MSNSQKALLLLQDGTLFQGKAYGAIGTTVGEICFNTSMTGYQEIFTDPSYYGQVIIMNNCYTGNYATKETDVESNSVKISGLICKNISNRQIRDMSDASLDEYLKKNNIVCIYDIDTRALVTHVRTQGAMNCIISSEIFDTSILQQKLKDVPSMEGLQLFDKVTTLEAYNFGHSDSEIKIAVLDYGVKRNILQCMADRGAYLKIFPAGTSLNEINSFNPDGYFISNGPGDPDTMADAVELTKQILETNKPTFGICLGHQILAQAVGIHTFKMHHGHRGSNHPILNTKTGVAEISTQNHGFAVLPKDVENNSEVEITHVNLNDKSIEGIKLKNRPAFSVQHHPEATPGPHDSRYLFDDFINLIKKSKSN